MSRELRQIPSAADILSSPDFYPLSIDHSRHTLRFVKVDRGVYHDLPFMDRRFVGSRGGYELPLDEVLALSSIHLGRRAGRTLFVMHAGYCCSTLLARYLQPLAHLLVVREPALLTQVVWMHGAFQTRQPFVSSALRLAVTLLSRVYEGQDTALLKVNDFCNVLGERLLLEQPASKMLIMTLRLPEFLISVLKGKERREWIQARFASVWRATRGRSYPYDIENNLPDCEAAAYVWTIYKDIFGRLESKFPDRVKLIDGPSVADEPLSVLQTVGDWFQLKTSRGTLEEIVASPISSRHAKDSDRPYSSEVRRAEMTMLARVHKSEIAAGLEFAQKLTDGLGQTAAVPGAPPSLEGATT